MQNCPKTCRRQRRNVSGREQSVSCGGNQHKRPQPPLTLSLVSSALLSSASATDFTPFPPSPGIPTLILLDAEGHMITRQGRVEVLNDPECRLFPWHPRPVLELSESNAVQLHEGPCLVLFVGELALRFLCNRSAVISLSGIPFHSSVRFPIFRLDLFSPMFQTSFCLVQTQRRKVNWNQPRS